MHFRRTSSNRDRRMRNHRTRLNRDRRMRNPPHVCTSVRSLQPMYVRPSLQHMYVHRFASRIHLRNTGSTNANTCPDTARAFFRSTLLALQSVHCSPRCPSIAAVHLPVHLFAARMHSRRRVLGFERVQKPRTGLVKITGQMMRKKREKKRSWYKMRL